jgi:hypothetical protein
MRTLSLSTVSLTSGELAKRAQLGRTSIYPALHALERAGILEFVGAGAQSQVQIREQHPLARPLRQLFRAEARRFEKFIAALRELLADVPFRPMSAWTYLSEQATQSTNTLSLYFVARPEEVERLTDVLNSRLAKVEHAYDIHLAVNGLTRSELKTLHDAPTDVISEAILLAGVPPIALLAQSGPPSGTFGSHDEHDKRSRRLALAIATKIKRDPGLVALARQRIERRVAKASPGERRELIEWIRVLSTMSPARLRRLLLEDSERAIRLRQSLPSLNLLSHRERDAVIRSQTEEDVIAAMKSYR